MARYYTKMSKSVGNFVADPIHAVSIVELERKAHAVLTRGKSQVSLDAPIRISRSIIWKAMPHLCHCVHKPLWSILITCQGVQLIRNPRAAQFIQTTSEGVTDAFAVL